MLCEEYIFILTNYKSFDILYIETLCIVILCIGGVIMNIKKELTKGSSALLVLSVLENEEMYGYQIIKEIEKRSEDVFSFKEGTLYPILHAFEKDNYVESYWQESNQGRKRKYYRITDKGRKVLVKSKEEWDAYSTAVKKVIKPQTSPVTA